MSACGTAPDLEVLIARPDVHGKGGAEVGEAGVHLAGDRPAARPWREVAGEQSRLGPMFAEVVGDGERAQITTSPCTRHGTRNEGESRRSSARTRRSVAGKDLRLQVQAREAYRGATHAATKRRSSCC